MLNVSIIHSNLGSVKFVLNVLASGQFELKESNNIVASGQISTPTSIDKELLNLSSPKIKKDRFLPLESAEIYKELRLKGYDYKGQFRGIQSIDNTGKTIYHALNTFLFLTLLACIKCHSVIISSKKYFSNF